MDNSFIVGFFLINGIFWGLFPHTSHCKLLSDFNKVIGSNIKCPSHTIHLLMGIVSYLLAVYFSQQKYIHRQLM